MKLSVLILVVLALVSIGCAPSPSASTSSPAGPSAPEPQWKGVMENEEGEKREISALLTEGEESVSQVALLLGTIEMFGSGVGPMVVEGTRQDFRGDFGIRIRRWELQSVQMTTGDKRVLTLKGQNACGECDGIIMKGEYKLIGIKDALDVEKGIWQMQIVQ